MSFEQCICILSSGTGPSYQVGTGASMTHGRQSVDTGNAKPRRPIKLEWSTLGRHNLRKTGMVDNKSTLS